MAFKWVHVDGAQVAFTGTPEDVQNNHMGYVMDDNSKVVAVTFVQANIGGDGTHGVIKCVDGLSENDEQKAFDVFATAIEA